MIKKTFLLTTLALLAVFTANAQTVPQGLQYGTESRGISIQILRYTGRATTLVIPPEIEGLPVTRIGSDAFRDCTSLTSVTIQGTIARNRFDSRAFYPGHDLQAVYLGAGGGPGTYTRASSASVWTKQ